GSRSCGRVGRMWGGDPELDLDGAERWIGDWQAGIEERAARARALSSRLADVTATAISRDGLVEATVAASGAVVDLRLDERIRNRPAAETARQVLDTIGAAQAEL